MLEDFSFGREDKMIDKMDPNYQKLVEVLEMSYRRAAEGKGKAHHSRGETFDEQWILRGMRKFGIGGGCFQIGKKLEQLEKISDEQKINELLDIIVYSAAIVIFLQEKIVKDMTEIPEHASTVADKMEYGVQR